MLPASANRTVLIDGLSPGRYLLEKARAAGEGNQVVTYARGVTVQPDPRASDMTRVNAEDVSHLFGVKTRTITGDLPADLVPRGGEFWKLFIVGLVVMYAIEAIAGFLGTARRGKERGPGAGVGA